MNPINYFKSGAWKATAKVVGRKVVETRPEIMLIVGGVSMLAGTIYACVKTPQAKEVIDATKEVIAAEENLNKICDDATNTVPTQEEKAKRGKKYLGIYAKAGFKIAQIYAIPAFLWGGGILSICGAHKELRVRNTRLLANSVAIQQLFNEYRGRVSDAVGEETENKIFMGAQEGMVQVLETDEKTGEEKLVSKKADVFVAQSGSIFARNFTPATCDAFDIRSYADYFVDSRIEGIKKDLSLGLVKFYSGAEILRKLGLVETEIGPEMIENGISKKGPELKVTRLQGYEKIWDEDKQTFIYRPCLRLDFNFYPLKGMI
jgi:hypothetical protein